MSSLMMPLYLQLSAQLLCMAPSCSTNTTPRWMSLLYCHDSTILFSFYAYLFRFLFFTYGRHVTYLVIGSHVGHMIGHLTCHLTWAHDQSCDHGLIFFSHMSHYDSLHCVSSILTL